MCDTTKLCGDCKYFCENMFIPGYERYKRCAEGLPMYVLAVAPACKSFQERSNMEDLKESYCVTCKFFSLENGECRLCGENVKAITKACQLYESRPAKEDDFFDDGEDEDISDQFIVLERFKKPSKRVTLNDAHYVELSKKAAAMDYHEQYAMASQFLSDVLFEVLSDRLRSHEDHLKRLRNILDGKE